MTTEKTYKFLNNNEKGKIVINGSTEFDFTRQTTNVNIIVDKIEKINVFIEHLILQNNQVQTNVVEFPFEGRDVIVEIKANFNLELINVQLT